MHRETLPSSTLPAWAKLNDITFLDIHIQELGEEGKGLGLVASRKLNSKGTCERPTLLEVPGDLVLSAEGLEEWKKVDGRLREVLEKVGGRVCFHFFIYLEGEGGGGGGGVWVWVWVVRFLATWAMPSGVRLFEVVLNYF